MRLLLITILTLFSVFIGFLGLRFYGSLKTYSPYQHELLNERPKPWIIYQLYDDQMAGKLPWIAFNIFITIDGKVAILSDEDFRALKQFNFKEKKSISQLNSLNLEDFLVKYPQQKLLLRVQNNAENSDLILKAILERTKSDQNVMIDSQFDIILESTKKLLPRSLFGTGIGERSRLILLDGMLLSSIAPINGDFVISTLKQGKFILLNSETRVELSRRSVIYIADLTQGDSIENYKELSPDAWLTTDLNLKVDF